MSTAYSDRPHLRGINDDAFGFGAGIDTAPDVLSGFASALGKIRVRRASEPWAQFEREACLEMFSAFGEPDGFKELARRIFNSSMTHGFCQGENVHRELSSGPDARLHSERIILDRLYRLAEAVGACSCLSPEHGQLEIHVGDAPGVLAAIEAAIGVDLTPPKQDGALFGLRCKGGVFFDRHFDGIYGAWRATDVAASQGLLAPSIVEVGGGAGHLTYYAARMGASRCGIIDLPVAQAVQYLLLATEFGTQAVTLGNRTNNQFSLLSAGAAGAEQIGRFDLLINVDSLPEMPPAAALEYLSHLRSGQLFLSINQESGVQFGGFRQTPVSQLAKAAGLKRLYRHPAWLRTGYVEELYVRPH